MPAIPASTRSSITLRLLDHAEKHWPSWAKFRSPAAAHSLTSPAYCPAVTSSAVRLRYGGSAHSFASPSTPPPATATKTPSCSPGSHRDPQEALDTACTVHLAAIEHEPDP